MRARTRSVVVGISVAVVLVLSGIVVSQPPPPPTYYGQVAAILEQHCTGCHTAGGIAPFSLEDPEIAVRMAPAIKYVVERGIMPPWPPGPDSPPMIGERKLSPQEKEILITWAEAGAPLGDPQDRPPRTAQPRLPDPPPHRLLTLTPPYQPNLARSDDYRCFLLDPQIERDTFVTGYRVFPGQKKLVHHVILFVIGPQNLREAEAKDQSEPGAGWTCYGGPGVGSMSANVLGDSLGFWVPGTTGTDFPAGIGKLLKAGSRIIMQVHYNTRQATPEDADATQVALYLSSEKLTPLEGMTLFAPVEVRCPGPYPDDPNDPCHRDYALARTELAFVANGIHALCRTQVEDFLKRDVGDGSAQEMHCDRPLRQDVLALGITGHMHLRGKSLRIEVNPGTPRARTLLSIPRWDFNWQGQYWFQEPIALKAGETIRLSCVYDNSQTIIGPDRQPLPPRYMTWGEGTTDEMCLGGIAFVRP
jgi:hypothetical protein